MVLRKVINEIILEFFNEKNNTHFYRAIPEFIGKSVTFEPKGYYEATDDEGNPITVAGDVWAKSNIPELAASKTVGGAILGLWSMGNHHGLKINKCFIYQINEKPQKDLSHLRRDDFEYIKEVRYLKPVKGKYVGNFIYNQQFNNNAVNFYNRLTDNPWDEYTDIDVERWEDFENLILTLNKSDLK